MNHIDLFSGIGGFAYAAREVWGDDYNNILFCDNNKFCQEVIKKNFGKDSVIYDDIREVTADSHRIRLQESRAKQQAGGNRQLLKTIANPKSGKSREPSEQKGRQDTRGSDIDLLTGGFPCQPFSQAGKRRGTGDDRYLWPEMFRIIRDFKPAWVIAENVRGLLTINEGMVFEQVCLNLEGEGYKVQAFVIPACTVNAPHRRDRLWIVSHKQGKRLSESGEARSEIGKGDARRRRFTDNFSFDTNAHTKRFQGAITKRNTRTRGQDNKYTWDTSWLEVATQLCGVDDGLPAELDGFKLTKAGHRVERLKALGNAIVPQVAMEIMRAIKSSS